jgi:hypothetical protein
LDILIKSYREMKLLGEVWAKQASVGANQQELTTSAKKCGQEKEEKNFGRGEFKTPMQGQAATNGCPPVTA